MPILNLTKEVATPVQIKAGLVDLPEVYRQHLVDALTLDPTPSNEELMNRADYVAQFTITNGLSVDDFDDDPIFTRALIDNISDAGAEEYAVSGSPDTFMSYFYAAGLRRYIEIALESIGCTAILTMEKYHD